MKRVLLAALFVFIGCGSRAPSAVFSPDWQYDGGRSIMEVYERVRGSPVPEGPGLAVGVTEAGLAGVMLDGSSRWSYSGPVDARPDIAGGVVVATGGGQLYALEATSGRKLWQVPVAGKRLRGAGDDGRVTVATVANPAGGGSLVVAVDRTGEVIRRLTPATEAGVPAVQGGVLFVPWGNQYVSAVDLETGDEIGRLLARLQVTRALAIDGALYFGERGLVRFDEAAGQTASDEAHQLELAKRELPGGPQWHTSGVLVEPAAASARDKTRLYGRPELGGDELGLDSSRFAATYFRIAIGFDGKSKALRWVRTFPADIIGGAAADGGFALCTEKGVVHLVAAARGGDAGQAELGTPVRSCVVQGGGFSIPKAKAAAPLPQQIGKAIEVHETDMVAIQSFLLKRLKTMKEPFVTQLLVELASDARTPPALLEEARKLLAGRRTGAEYMLKALERRYDFLNDVLRPPPVGPLADALAAMREKRAAPLLAEHLNEPADTTDDIKRAAKALVVLATEEEADELRTFFSLYRATASDENLVSAVISAAKALLNVGGEEGARIVQHAANDPLTHPAVKQGLAGLVNEAG